MTGAPISSSLSPSLSLLQCIPVFLLLVSPEPDTELQLGLTSAKQRSTNTSLDQLVMLFLLQPRILLAFLPQRLMAGSQPAWCLPGPVCHSLQSCFSAAQPQPVLVLVIRSDVLDLDFHLSNFMRLVLAYISKFSRHI